MSRSFAAAWTVACHAPLPWDFPGKTAGVVCSRFLEGIFPTQWSNPGLLHCRFCRATWEEQRNKLLGYIVKKSNKLKPSLPTAFSWNVSVYTNFMYLFIKFFWMWTIFKVFIELVTVLLLFYVLVLWTKICGILAPPPGIESSPPILEGKVLTAGLQGKSILMLPPNDAFF